MDNQEYMNSKFQMPYLKTVVFEIRFPSDLSVIQQKFTDFQKLVNEDFPNISEGYLLPPQGFPIDPKTLITARKFSLETLDGHMKINIAHDFISLLITDYQTIEIFTNRVKKYFDFAIQVLQIKTATRMGLRYYMKYDFEEKKEFDVFDKFKKYFKPLWNTNVVEINSLITQGNEVRKKLDDKFAITLRSKFNRDPYSYELDFDVYTTKSCSFSDFIEILQELRTYEKQYFLNMITKEFLNFLNAKPS